MRKPRPDTSSAFPAVSPSLVKALEGVFPVPIPQPGQTIETIWSNTGAWKVVEFLRRQAEEQSTNLTGG